PPPRCGAPMVYDPAAKVIVMFGGHDGLVRSDLRPSSGLGSRPGGLSDTWLYDVTTRQWRELKTRRRPPAQRLPKLLYDPTSRLVLLVTFAPGAAKGKATSTIWSLDLAKGRWRRRGRQTLPLSLSFQGTYANHTPLWDVVLDEAASLLIFRQNVEVKRVAWEQSAVMRLEVAKLPTEPLGESKPEPPIAPQVLPPDDPAWVAKLKALPANTWTPAKPRSRTATRRDWGNAACDPIHGHVYYFGGGHATYQVNDVAIYAVGANRWVHAPGDHNDFLPPVGWGGIAMGYRGGRHAHHMRNQYVALDGRMYVSTGGQRKWQRYGAIEAGQARQPRYAWFYDLDRGGAWRQLPVGKVTRGKGVDGDWGAVHVVDPAGRILGFAGYRKAYYSYRWPELFVSVYDIYRNELDVRKVPAPFPWRWPEARPFCYLAGKGRVFFYEYLYDKAKAKAIRHHTWVYDVKANRFIDLKPKRQPPGIATTVEYIPAQDAVFAVIDRKSQWVYSFARNTWAELPLAGAKPGFPGPYGQIVYAAKYGVLVTPRDGTRVMRPDVTKARWDD
ncbi:hypothetical protein LCGC14_1595150, partial [marine sediment metagenome]